MKAVNLAEKFAEFSDCWIPKVVGELNGQQVRLVKLRGEFVWHRGTEHLPVAPEEVHVLLFEPATTLNTGNVEGDRTVRVLQQL